MDISVIEYDSNTIIVPKDAVTIVGIGEAPSDL
jgi:hypothetical protein